MPPVRQEYIAKVKYTNSLPPPVNAPKLVKIPVDRNALIGSNLLSSMIPQQGFRNLFDQDAELGMPIDLLGNRMAFHYHTNIEGAGGINPLSVNGAALKDVELHPKDRELLFTPGGSNRGSRTMESVAFLRRTEYISDTRNVVEPSSPVKRKPEQSEDDDSDPYTRLQAVINTFEASNPEEIAKMVHPVKKLKATAVYPVLPDAKMMDLTFLSMKLVPGANQAAGNEERSAALDVALFRPVALDTDEWISLYKASESSAEKLKEKLSQLEENPIGEEAEDERFKFRHVKDYDMKFTQHNDPCEEIAISFQEGKGEGEGEDGAGPVAYYVPINGKIELKRRRVHKQLQLLAAQHDVDVIELSRRDPTTEEVIARDNARSAYDPVNFTEIQEMEEKEGEGEEGEGEGNEEEEGEGNEERDEE